MTPIAQLSPHELASINTSRAERGLPLLFPVLRVEASASGVTPPAPPASTQAFNAGVAEERGRSVFATNLRIATARRLQARAAGSRDPVAIALLRDEEIRKKDEEFKVETVLPPSHQALTVEQQAFADRLCRKIKSVLPRTKVHARVNR
jgi:hypothetical protein